MVAVLVEELLLDDGEVLVEEDEDEDVDELGLVVEVLDDVEVLGELEVEVEVDVGMQF